MFGTEVDFIETLKFSKSRRSISSTVSIAAVTSASTGLSYSSWRRCLGSEPELTPTRSGVPFCLASAITSATFSGPPMLPGFSRTQWAPASIAFRASVWLKWMSAITGIGDSATIVFSASASCSRGTATRTMSAPASATVADLVHRRGEVRGLGLGHRLDRDGAPPPIGDAADVDLALRGHRLILRCPTVYATARRPAGPLAAPLAPGPGARRHARFFALTRTAARGRGCWTSAAGSIGLRALEPELDITGVDLVERPGYPGPFVHADAAEGLPFADGEFDLVYCSSVIEHVPPARREAFAAELRRVGARLVRADARLLVPARAPRAAAGRPLAARRAAPALLGLGAAGRLGGDLAAAPGELEALFGPRRRAGAVRRRSSKSWVS